ncbi:hypothetical protein J4214_00415 [Candidatus Woesearchaeota archaeon]|nr:hypothetical protein [Candidatus Woesearchaeota archaeon]
MVDSVPILKFDKNNPHHKRLAELSEKAHNTKERVELDKIEQEIDKLAENALIKH